MLPKYHIIIGAVFSAVFPEISYIEAGIVFLSSVLIDFDHYVYYVYKKRSLSLKKAYNWFLEKRERNKKLSKKQIKNIPGTPFIFHGFEIILLLFVSGILFSKYFLFILIGISLHLILDLIEQFRYSGRTNKISFINDFLNSR